MNPLRLEARAIEKRFGRITALRSLDFIVEPGEAVAILGANGAGKSSLLRILAGLSRPSQGEFLASAVATDGRAGERPNATLPRNALRGEVGYVGHSTLIYGELTARENLRFAARLHGKTPPDTDLDRHLEDVGLLDVADRRADQFSRGMAQRLSIARAVVHDPGLLLLDEPFTGLDEHSANRLATQLSRLREDGRTVILVTHEPGRASEISDRALILHRGALQASPRRGEPDFEAPALRETLIALASNPGAGRAA